MKIVVFLLLFVMIHFGGFAQTDSMFSPSPQDKDRLSNSQWKGRTIVFLGDSITDKRRIGTNYVYWEYLREMLMIHPLVYGQSGHTWKNVLQQAEKLSELDMTEIAAILIFAGTNDFNNGIPMGALYTESSTIVNHNGNQVDRMMRKPNYAEDTFYGRINTALQYLKSKYPEKQIIILTPLHRGFAQFSASNIQPDEQYANAKGLYISDYVEALKLAAAQWSVPVIDLYGASGLQPMLESNSIFFADKNNDLLHPNALGHLRMARFIAQQMLFYPL